MSRMPFEQKIKIKNEKKNGTLKTLKLIIAIRYVLEIDIGPKTLRTLKTCWFLYFLDEMLNAKF